MKTNVATIWRWVWHLVFIAVIACIFYPIIFALANSFKTEAEAYANAMSLITDGFSFDNYARLFTRLPMFTIMWNTFVVAFVATLSQVVCAFLAAYAVVYYQFRGQKLVVAIMMIALFLPFTVTMIPNYIALSKVKLLDTMAGVILPQVFNASVMFLLIQSMRNIPKALIESFHMDGAKDLAIMRDLVLPLIKPQLIATGIWFFAFSWNDYVWPRLILKSTDNYTLPLALQMFISGEGGDGFTAAMAMSIVTMIIPLALYLVFQKYIIDTFTSSGIK